MTKSRHVSFMVFLRKQGLAPWQIALWDRKWTTRYVTRALESRFQRGKEKPWKPLPQAGSPTKEQWMQHHFRYVCGVEYQCLRCKRIGEKEEINEIACIAVEDEYRARVRKNARKSAKKW